MMGSSRTTGVERSGGNAGTNRDPDLYAAALKADWHKFTGGRAMEPVRPGRVRSVKIAKSANPWKQSNILYMRNPKRGAK
jgi:hypothetical protein